MGYLPMYKNIAVPKSSSVYEVLRQVLVRRVRCHYAQVVLVLSTKRANLKKNIKRLSPGPNCRAILIIFFLGKIFYK